MVNNHCAWNFKDVWFCKYLTQRHVSFHAPGADLPQWMMSSLWRKSRANKSCLEIARAGAAWCGLPLTLITSPSDIIAGSTRHKRSHLSHHGQNSPPVRWHALCQDDRGPEQTNLKGIASSLLFLEASAFSTFNATCRWGLTYVERNCWKHSILSVGRWPLHISKQESSN